MDENIAQFTALTETDPAKAAQYLKLTDNDLEQALLLFFEGPGDLDLGGSGQAQTSSTLPPQTSRPRNDEDIIQIDSDDDMGGADVDDDAAMARRVQEEEYRGSGAGLGRGDDEVRAPMARTTETLVGGPDSYEPDFTQDIINDHLRARQARHAPGASRGIFHQADVPSSWAPDDESPVEAARRRDRDRAARTNGAGTTSGKARNLTDLFGRPFDMMCRLPWDQARDRGKEQEKWIMVNVQDEAIFDCHRFNRDIWANPDIKETVQANFLFMQYTKEEPQGNQYVQYYFQNRDSSDAYPHVAIVDPRTGEQVKVWSGPPVPDVKQFLGQLHEFLDRYSLKSDARNPVATKKPEKKQRDVHRMTEEEQLEMAMQNSLGNHENTGPRDEDPDDLTRQGGSSRKGKEKAEEAAPEPQAEASAFSRIPSDRPHEEPANDPATTTRIQFRHSGGRTIHRFGLAEPVQRIYEWLKASPIEGKDGIEFELIAMGKNLIEQLDTSIADAGLKNGTVMVELLES